MGDGQWQQAGNPAADSEAPWPSYEEVRSGRSMAANDGGTADSWSWEASQWRDS